LLNDFIIVNAVNQCRFIVMLWHKVYKIRDGSIGLVAINLMYCKMSIRTHPVIIFIWAQCDVLF